MGNGIGTACMHDGLDEWMKMANGGVWGKSIVSGLWVCFLGAVDVRMRGGKGKAREVSKAGILLARSSWISQIHIDLEEWNLFHSSITHDLSAGSSQDPLCA